MRAISFYRGRRLLGVGVMVGILAAAGCESGPRGADRAGTGGPATPGPADVDTTSPGPPPPGGPAMPQALSPAVLQTQVRNFADQYRQTIAEASDQIIHETSDSAMRRRANQTKLSGATAMYNVAVDPVPAEALLNAVVLVSLQSSYLERHGDELFGRFYPMLAQRTAYLQEEVFRIAARVMTDQQRIYLLELCKQWSQAHPDQRDFWYVRLNDLPGLRGDPSVLSVVDELTDLPGEFINIFNPFAGAQASVSQTAILAERMAWLAPRLMILAQWRAEAVIYDTLATAEISSTLEMAQRLTTVAETLPETIDQQRTALFNALEENEDTLSALLNDTQATLDAAQGITTDAVTLVERGDTAIASTDELMNTLDGVVARVQAMQQASLEAEAAKPAATQPEEPGRPFDITEYTEAINALNEVIRDTNTLVKTLDSSVTADALDARMGAVQGRISDLIWLIGLVVLGGSLVIILAVKLIPSRRRSALREPSA